MKIRISKNTIRYRLNRPEVERFSVDGVITEKIHIGDQPFTYSLQRAATERISITYHNNIMALTVPEHIADEWTGTEQVGFDGTDEYGLHLLVEKDFVCLDEVAEDQRDNYPNPLATK